MPLFGDFNFRTIASGSTDIVADATVTLATVTIEAQETVNCFAFVADDVASLGFGAVPEILATVADSVIWWFVRTANAGEFLLKAKNRNAPAGATRTLNWNLVVTSLN